MTGGTRRRETERGCCLVDGDDDDDDGMIVETKATPLSKSTPSTEDEKMRSPAQEPSTTTRRARTARQHMVHHHRIPRPLHRIAMVWLFVALGTLVLPTTSADGYNCDKPRRKCLATGESSTGAFDDIETCMHQCSNFSSLNNVTINSGMNGTCFNCSMAIRTNWNFPEMFESLDLTAASLANSQCKFTARFQQVIPKDWTVDTDPATNCKLQSVPVPCQISDDKTQVTATISDAKTMSVLLSESAWYTLKVAPMSTPPIPKNELREGSALKFQFSGTGCLASVDRSKTRTQLVDLALSNAAVSLLGNFTNLAMTADNLRMNSTSSVTISFRSGCILDKSSVIILQTAVGDSQRFSRLIEGVKDTAVLKWANKQFKIGVSGSNNLTFNFSVGNFDSQIRHGDAVNITFDNFFNPVNASPDAEIDYAYLSAYVMFYTAIETTRFDFFKVDEAKRTWSPSVLDIASVSIFGLCFLLSLLIVRWHGLPLTLTTLWTDMVAVSALFSFATGCGGSLVWILVPSQSWVYWYAAQYFFNTVMILSLCFHWLAVLSFKSFKKLTFKSPVVYAYFIMNGIVLGFIIILSITYNSKLPCVFNEKVATCVSLEECKKPVPASGQAIRNAVSSCGMNTFYVALGTGFMIYTLLLMVLGCMVMSRGRSLMLNEDPNDQRIRKSLTIFYVIISTTCVLYISAQVIFITQFTLNSGELSDLVWYVFIVWLPQSVPPLLLLFLQWNPSTERLPPPEESIEIGNTSKDNVLNLTPRSSDSSPNMHYAKLARASIAESVLNEEPGSKLRLIVRLRVPSSFDRSCFVSLDYFASKEAITSNLASRSLYRAANWQCVGTTERVGGESEKQVSSGGHSIFPFVAVLEVPVMGPASGTLLRFMVHVSTFGRRESALTGSQVFLERNSSFVSKDDSSNNSYQMTMFQPLCEFVTSSQAVLDAAANGQPLNVHPVDENTCTLLEDSPSIRHEVETLLDGNLHNAELSVQTVMMPGEAPSREDMSAHRNIGNIVRFFQYDAEDGRGGLVVEDLQESTYANSIPRQFLELIAAERHEQVQVAREELNTFLNQKKGNQDRGFYGTLIGQIQDEGDTALAREWLEARLKKRKEYVALLRKNIQFLVNRDKHKLYFKASVEKKNDDLRFVPINLHIQDLLIGPMSAFLNEERRRSSKMVTRYEFTTVGAFASHCYKFNKGGILSYQNRLQKMREKISDADFDLLKWPEELREYDDAQWDLQLRMDCCLCQAAAALTACFVRRVEVALQNPDPQKGEDILRQFSTLGYLFQVESLLSTHGKEIGMLEDMAGVISQLSCIAFVIQDIRDRPTGRFSFRKSRKNDGSDDAQVMKVSVSQKPQRDIKKGSVKYIITVQVVTGDIGLPDRLAAGGEILVTPVLFTQGINEMQTIANNTERTKTELQDTININNLRPLKAFCDKYCRLMVAMTSHGSFVQRGYKQLNGPMHLSEDHIYQEFHALEASVLDAAQSLVKTKRPEILRLSSDLCRELGGGRVTVCKSAKDRTAMSVTLEQVRILHRHHDLPEHRIPGTVSVMRSHGVRIENALKNTGKRQFAFNKLQRSLLPEEYRCPDAVAGAGNVS